MSEKQDNKSAEIVKKKFKVSRLGLYIVIFGWLSFLVTISQAFEWADFETVFLSFFSADIKVLPFRALALSIPLIFTVIGYMVFMREKFLGQVLSSGRKLESKNLSLETSYKKLYGKMKEGVAGSSHTILLEESKVLSRGFSVVLSDVMDFRIRHISPDVSSLLKADMLRFRAITLLQEGFARANEPGKMDVRGYIRAISRELMEFYGMTNVKLDVDVKVNGLGMGAVLPCGVIICELVMNSLKYAFKEVKEPAVMIGMLMASRTDVLLRYSDNGIGLPDGLDISSLDSIGFKLLGKMSRAMKGRVARVDSVQGVAFDITFPLRNESSQ